MSPVPITMARHPLSRSLWSMIPLLVVVGLFLAGRGPVWGQEAEDGEPELRLRATPRVAFAPAQILVVAELRGGSDHHEPLYCASVEWDWDDGTRSESIPDCDPYEPGVSEIRRRFSMRHAFQRGGMYEVRFSLKQRDDVISSARTTVQVRGGRPFR